MTEKEEAEIRAAVYVAISDAVWEWGPTVAVIALLVGICAGTTTGMLVHHLDDSICPCEERHGLCICED